MLTFLSVLKACCYSVSYLNSTSFLVNLVSSNALLEQQLINCLLKLQNSKKNYMFLTFFSISQFLTTLIFFKLILTLYFSTIYSKNLTFFLQNLYFSSLSCSSTFSKYSSTIYTCWIYFLKSLEKTKILFKYATINMFKYALNTLLIST